MKNYQLKELLISLDRSELKDFGKYVRSPYFNNRSELIRFYNAIKKYHPKFDSAVLNEESIFKAVYPGKKYSDVLMRKLYSLTTNLLLDFISVKAFRENKLEYNIKLLDKLRERKLFSLFEKRSAVIDEFLSKSKHDISYYESKLKHATILNWYLLNTSEKSMVSRLQNELEDVLEYFHVAAILQYIKLGEWSRIINKKFDQKFSNEIINYFANRKKNEITLSYLYFNMMMLLNTEEEKYYTELMKGRKKFESKLSDMDDYNIALVSMQYCHKKVIKGNNQYRKYQFEITKMILEKNLIPPGFIEPYFFTNTVRNASGIGKFNWAEDFIEKYRKRLNPELEEELTQYSYALIEFWRGNFENSLRYLSKINMERLNMKLEIKNLLIVIYYELNYKEELISLIDTYKHFLSRDKNITKQLKQQSGQFLKFVTELIKIFHSGNSEYAFLLLKRLEKTPYFISKEWLIKKAEELCKKNSRSSGINKNI